MGEPVDIKARQELNTPATWDAGEMVFVRREDGTAAMYVTSASGVPHEVTGGDTAAALYADGTGGVLTLYREVPDAPATPLARSGTPVNTPAIPANVLNATMFFRVLAATPLTGVQLGGLTLSNGPVQAFITQHTSDAGRTFQGQVVESGALTPQSGGHHATFAGGVTLQPGTLYGLRLGNSQGGVAPQVQLASPATYTGQGWSGLILDPYLRWYTNATTMGEASYATAAETPAFDVLFEVPTVVTPDEALLTVRAGAGLAAEVTGPEINLRAALNLSQYGATPDQVTHAWTPGSTSGVSGQPGYRFRYTTSGPLMISGLNVALPAGRTLKLRTGGVTYTTTTTSGGVTFNPPVQVVGGAFELDIDTLGGSYPSGSNLIAGATTTDGLITIVSVAQLNGAGAEMGSPGTTGGLNAGVLSGLPVVFGQLPPAAVGLGNVLNATQIPAAEKGAANGVASLGADGKLLTAQLPAIAIGEVFTAASQAEMLALTAQHGDVALRTDQGSARYLLTGTSAATLTDWTRLNDPAAGSVTSVNGQTGVVNLGAGDVGATPASHATDTTNPHAVTKAQVGLGNVDNTSDASKPVSTAQQAALNLKAPLASPAFTGVPTVPTAAPGTNTTQVASTAFVTAALSTAGGGLTIRETDGSPSAVFTTLEVPNGTLQDGGNGKAIYTPLVAGVYLGTTAPSTWSVASNATLATTSASPPVTMPFDATASVAFDKIYMPYSVNSAIPNGVLVEVLVGGSVVASGTVGAGSYNATFNRLVQLNATVTRSAGQAFSLRFSVNGSGWDGKFTVVTNGSFPYVYGSGGGIRQTDAPVAPYYPLALTFQGPGGTVKNTTGPGFTVGSTAERPVSPAIGDQHMDTTLSKPVWWWGSAWKDAAGTTA